jgi:hypothetical protein
MCCKKNAGEKWLLDIGNLSKKLNLSKKMDKL